VPDAKDAAAEVPVLNKWTIAHATDKRYWFGNESDQEDPRSQNEDLGDNAMKAGEYGIKNLKRIMTHLVEWTKEENEGYENLQGMHVQVFQQFSRYVGHVLKNIGGRYETLKTVEQAGQVYEPVPAATQAEAMRFIQQQVFTTPMWLLDKKILTLTGSYPMDIMNGLQDNTFNRLISSQIFTRLINNQSVYGKTYTLTDLFVDLEKGVWGELDTRTPVDLYRRNLQRLYIERMTFYLTPAAATIPIKRSEYTAIIRAHLIKLRARIQQALPAMQDTVTRYHLQDMMYKIDNTLAVK